MNNMITFTALIAEKSDQDLILESLVGEMKTRPTKEIEMSLKREEVKHYYACSEYKGLTRLVTIDNHEFIVDEKWAMFDWRYKQESDQEVKPWQEYNSNDWDITIRTYLN